MVIAGMALLCGASVIRERDGLRNTWASHQYLKNQLDETRTGNLLIRRELSEVRENREILVQKAQQQLNYLRANEIVVVVK